ncbi:hypothetical protein ACIGBH_25090 [Streptomyces sp. NPDC085929]|uniref:hypothetical protein n=1 Tax=Streptomyces sp. NPDC085929 TaxID=3365739 RepID=UPI0037D6D5C7
MPRSATVIASLARGEEDLIGAAADGPAGVHAAVFDLGIDGAADALAFGGQPVPVASPLAQVVPVGIACFEGVGEVVDPLGHGGVEVGDGLLPMVGVAGGSEHEMGGEATERSDAHGRDQVADVGDLAPSGGEREEADDGDLSALLPQAPDHPWTPANAARDAASVAPAAMASTYWRQSRTERYTVACSATSAVNGANVETGGGSR